MRVTIFSTVLSDTFLILRRIHDVPRMLKIYIVLAVKYCYSCQKLMEFELPREILKKLSSIKFNENTSSGSRVEPCRRTDRHDDAFLNFANAPEIRGHFQYELWALGCLIFGYTLNI